MIQQSNNKIHKLLTVGAFRTLRSVGRDSCIDQCWKLTSFFYICIIAPLLFSIHSEPTRYIVRTDKRTNENNTWLYIRDTTICVYNKKQHHYQIYWDNDTSASIYFFTKTKTKKSSCEFMGFFFVYSLYFYFSSKLLSNCIDYCVESISKS